MPTQSLQKLLHSATNTIFLGISNHVIVLCLCVQYCDNHLASRVFQTMITIAFMGSGKGLDTYNKTCHATVSEIETRPLTCVMIAFLTISIMAVRTLRSHFHRAHFQRCNVDTLVRQPTHLCCHGQERQYCRTIPVGYRRPGYELTAHRARAV